MNTAIYGLELTGVIFLFIVGIAIVIGNCFVLAAVKLRPSLRTPLNIYVASICVSGVITGLLAPLQPGYYIGPIHYLHPVLYDCQVRRWLAVVFWTSSTNAILCMLAIAVERYRILFKRASPRNSGFVVAVIWALSLLYDSLMFGRGNVEFVVVNAENASETWTRISTSASNGTYMLAPAELNEEGAVGLKDQLPESEFWRYPYAKHCHSSAHCAAKWVHLANFIVAFVIPFVAILILYHLLSEALLESALGPNEERGRVSKGIFKATTTVFRTQSTLATHFPPSADTLNSRARASAARTSIEPSDRRNSTAPSVLLSIATLRRVENRKMERLRAVRGMRMVVLAFFSCWLPAHCMLLHAGFDHDWHGPDARNTFVGHLDWVHKLLHDIGVQVILAHNWIHLFIYPAYNKMFKAELKSLARALLDNFLGRCHRAPGPENSAPSIHCVEASILGRESNTAIQHATDNPVRSSRRQHSRREKRMSGGFGRFSLVLHASDVAYDTCPLETDDNFGNLLAKGSSAGGSGCAESPQVTPKEHKRRWSTGTKVNTNTRAKIVNPHVSGTKTTTTAGDSGIGKSEVGGPDEILTLDQLVALNRETSENSSNIRKTDEDQKGRHQVRVDVQGSLVRGASSNRLECDANQVTTAV